MPGVLWVCGRFLLNWFYFLLAVPLLSRVLLFVCSVQSNKKINITPDLILIG